MSITLYPEVYQGSEEWMAFFQDNEGRPLAIMSTVSAP